jgi:hypothetical protein
MNRQNALSHVVMGLQGHERETGIWRGYSSLKEIYHWSLIIYILAGEMVLVSTASSPLMNNLGFMDGESGSLSFALLFLLFYALLGIAYPLLPFIRYSREKRRRDVLRWEALRTENPSLAPIQPSSSQVFFLPSCLESSAKRFVSLRVFIIALFIITLLVINNILILGGFWRVPFMVAIIPYATGTILPGIMIAVARIVQVHIVEYYLLPSLHIDDNGIAARYGRRDTISMHWQDIRSFALVNSKTFGNVSGQRTISGIVKREAFELGDGENTICWLAGVPPRSYRLRLSNEVALSAQDYVAFTSQLTSLIVARTGLPLSDLRLLAHNRKRVLSQTEANPWLRER